eukprot:1745919-Pyramimonas_sp.AAC.1
MTRTIVFVPTLNKIDDAVNLGRPWLPTQNAGALDEENGNNAGDNNPPARLPVDWENNFRARPTRRSQSVSSWISVCRDHRLIIPVLRHATGEAAMAREQSQMDLDLSAISGPEATLITDGTITLDHSEGHVYFHRDDPLIKI